MFCARCGAERTPPPPAAAALGPCPVCGELAVCSWRPSLGGNVVEASGAFRLTGVGQPRPGRLRLVE